MSLREALEGLKPAADAVHQWRPVILDAATAAGRAELERLCGMPGIQLTDTLWDQLHELVETRSPRPRPPEVRREEARALLGGADPIEYGAWVYYPWSCRLVHLLPEAEFRELRTSRNRYKITEAEQARLASLTIGIIGLSVGHSSARVLALEGIGGELRLADFDTLSLSNLNRLPTGVHNLGLNKAVLCAREIVELNPWARLRVYEEGLTEENADAFLTEHGGVDLIVEECDDLFMKVFIRERARALRLPVVMETSDRGLIDVERFDLEADRPSFHGLVPPVRAEELRGLPTADKVPFVLDILGVEQLSPRFSGSLVEIDRTIKTWPQLASGVTLGGALNTDTIRRIALGELEGSGRYRVDLAREIRPEHATHEAERQARPRRAPWPVHDSPPGVSAAELEPPASLALPARRAWSVVAHALLAPSGGNSQPWRFVLEGARLRCLLDPTRAATFLDFRQSASWLALGAAAENADLAAGRIGLEARTITSEGDPLLAWELPLEARVSREEPSPLYAQVLARATNRRLGNRVPMDRAAADALSGIASDGGGRLQWLTSEEALEEIGRIIGAGERLRLLHPQLHHDMIGELRWTEEAIAETRDGLDVRALELSATDEAGMQVASQWPAMQVVKKLGGGRALEEPSEKSVRAASAVGLLTLSGPHHKSSFIQGGRVLQRVWLNAGFHGLSLQPLSALPYLFARLEREDGAGFDEEERERLRALRRRYLQLFRVNPSEEIEVLLFRVARAPPPRIRSLRRPVDAVLSLDAG